MFNHSSKARPASLCAPLLVAALLAACGGNNPPAEPDANAPAADAPTSDPLGLRSGQGGVVGAVGKPVIPRDPIAPSAPTAPTPSPADLRWSNPATWGGTLPGAGATVVIPAGRTIILDTNTASLGALDIQGTLTFADRDVALTAASIKLSGALNVGSATQRFVSKATITLTGAPVATNNGVARGIMVDGGKLALYGVAPSPVWTKLNDHAQAGSTSFTTADTLNWAAGSTIAVAPSDYYSIAETERLTLASTSTGKALNTTAGIGKFRWGKLQYVTAAGMSLTPDATYTPPALPAPTVLDERAEVANLSRNIVVQSVDDNDWKANGFGVHLMVMNLMSKVVIDGVEFRRAGQAGVTGRYPIHWHMLSYAPTTGAFIGDATGHVVRNSAIWNSSNRCVVLHATNGVTVQNNICQDIKGHAFFLEDAVERRNVFEGNLALMVRSPPANKLLQLHEGTVSNGGPSGFWLTNPDNIVRNNSAGDASGLGFWLAYPRKALGLSAAVPMLPDRLPHGAFEYNTAHSNKMPGVMLKFGPSDAAGNVGINIYSPTVDGSEDTGNTNELGNRVRFTLKGITSYKNLGGGYVNYASVPNYLEWVTADNVGVHFAGSTSQTATLQRGLMVGLSLNNGTGYFKQWPYDPPSAFATYHSAVDMKDNTAVNFAFVEGKPSGMFKTDDYYLMPVEVGMVRNTNNRVINSSPGYRTLPPNLDGQPFDMRNYTLAGAVWDANGYWGPKGNYWVYDYPFFTAGGNCQQVAPAGKNGQSCDGQYYGILGFETDYHTDRNTFFSSMQAIRQDSNGNEIGRWVVADGTKDATKAIFRHFAARAGGRFVIRFPNDPLPKMISFNVVNAFRDTDSFLVGMPFDGAATAAGYTMAGNNAYRFDAKVSPTNGMYASKYARYFKSAASLAEVTAGNGDLMWQDRANNMVWVRYRGGLGYPLDFERIRPGSDADLYRQTSVVLYSKP